MLPGNYKVNAGQDIMISVYNVHHSSEVKSKNFFLSFTLFLVTVIELFWKFSLKLFLLTLQVGMNDSCPQMGSSSSSWGYRTSV